MLYYCFTYYTYVVIRPLLQILLYNIIHLYNIYIFYYLGIVYISSETINNMSIIAKVVKYITYYMYTLCTLITCGFYSRNIPSWAYCQYVIILYIRGKRTRELYTHSISIKICNQIVIADTFRQSKRRFGNVVYLKRFNNR